MSEAIPSSGQLVKNRQYLPDAPEETDNLTKYLTFNVADETFGANIEFIKEIIEHGRYTRIPLSQSNIRGVINLRGHVVPVVDMANRLGYESQPITKRSCIIIVEIVDDSEIVNLGFVVDVVDEVIDLDNRCIEAAPSFGLDIRHDFIDGMGKLKSNEFVKLLDLNTVLSVKELSGVTENETIDM